MNLDEAIETIRNELWLHEQNGHKEVAANMKGVLAAMEQAKASVAHANTLAEQRLARSMHLEIIYHRYFMANMQTQKGTNRLVKKCQRQKAKIEQLQARLARAEFVIATKDKTINAMEEDVVRLITSLASAEKVVEAAKTVVGKTGEMMLTGRGILNKLAAAMQAHTQHDAGKGAK